jgi:hypothetical protein
MIVAAQASNTLNPEMDEICLKMLFESKGISSSSDNRLFKVAQEVFLSNFEKEGEEQTKGASTSDKVMIC